MLTLFSFQEIQLKTLLQKRLLATIVQLCAFSENNLGAAIKCRVYFNSIII